MTIWYKSQWRNKKASAPPGGPKTAVLIHFDNTVENAYGDIASFQNYGIVAPFYPGKFGEAGDTGNSRGFTWYVENLDSLVSQHPNTVDFWISKNSASPWSASDQLLYIGNVPGTSFIQIYPLGDGTLAIHSNQYGQLAAIPAFDLTNLLELTHVALMFEWDQANTTLRVHSWLNGTAKQSVGIEGFGVTFWDTLWAQIQLYIISGGVLIDEFLWRSGTTSKYTPGVSFTPPTAPYTT